MLMLFYYVPEEHLSKVNAALFELGLGHYENYSCCAWSTKGQGQFKPLTGSQPFIGQLENTELVDEFKVEMICPEHLKEQAVQALLKNHPYEVPAYGFISLIL